MKTVGRGLIVMFVHRIGVAFTVRNARVVGWVRIAIPVQEDGLERSVTSAGITGPENNAIPARMDGPARSAISVYLISQVMIATFVRRIGRGTGVAAV